MRSFSKRACRGTAPAWLATMLLALAGCGGGTVGPVVAGADTLTVAPGQTGNLLENDTLGGQPATAGAGGNVSFTAETGSLPAGINVSNGTVAVASSVESGSFSFTYRLCEAINSGNCASAAVQLTVLSSLPVIVATNDSLTLSAGGSASVLSNDTLGGAPATASTVVVLPNSALPVGTALSLGGVLSVGASAVVGNYSINYAICQVGVAGNCASATATLSVTL